MLSPTTRHRRAHERPYSSSIRFRLALKSRSSLRLAGLHSCGGVPKRSGSPCHLRGPCTISIILRLPLHPLSLMSPLPGVPSNLLGTLFAYGGFGILCVQLAVYHRHYPQDTQWLKMLVWTALALDVLITTLATIAAWNILGAGWGDLDVLEHINWPFAVLPLLTGLVTSLVQLFFAWRIWRLQKSLILPVIICMVRSLLKIKAGLPDVWQGEPRTHIEIYATTDMARGSALTDVLITVTLFRKGVQSAFKQTRSLLRRVIVLTIETGMTTSVVAILELGLGVRYPRVISTFSCAYFSRFFLVLSKVYSNTLLATLNSRTSRDESRYPPTLWMDGDSKAADFATTPIRFDTPGYSRDLVQSELGNL
ncbi:hypothetical protein B0H10DRAFT_2067801 [Mycena sp. CBHHK59/15]|nr:hypothetical protein B0H10DRAFT_2067801 [Mycena sp. CBHHK59/15]